MNKMREAFELWYETTTESEDDLTYHEWMWRSWQAALSQPAAVEGWVMVPVEPTPEMLEAGKHIKRMRLLETVKYHANGGTDLLPDSYGLGEGAEYRAMLSAAPTTPSTPAQQSVREAFEAAIVKDAPVSIAREGSGYASSYVNAAWWGWQAALSTSPLLDKNDDAWDRNAERLTAECLGTGKINMDATCIDDIFDAPQPDSNELVELRRDAGRYRWLQTESNRDYVDFNDIWYESADDLDAAIDEALAQSPSVGLNTKKGE
jgi:hypothetical protein